MGHICPNLSIFCIAHMWHIEYWNGRNCNVKLELQDIISIFTAERAHLDNIQETLYAKFNCSFRPFSMGSKLSCCAVGPAWDVRYRALWGEGVVSRQYCLSFLEPASFALCIVCCNNSSCLILLQQLKFSIVLIEQLFLSFIQAFSKHPLSLILRFYLFEIRFSLLEYTSFNIWQSTWSNFVLKWPGNIFPALCKRLMLFALLYCQGAEYVKILPAPSEARTVMNDNGGLLGWLDRNHCGR